MGRCTTGPKGHPDIRGGQGGGVVDAVAHHDGGARASVRPDGLDLFRR